MMGNGSGMGSMMWGMGAAGLIGLLIVVGLMKYIFFRDGFLSACA